MARTAYPDRMALGDLVAADAGGDTVEQDAAPPGNGLTGLLAEQFSGTHGAYNGTHTHEHDANDSQGSDAQHSHSHSHDGNGDHGHRHGASLAPEALARLRHPTFRGVPTAEQADAAVNAFRSFGFDDSGFVASSTPDAMLGAHWAIYGDERGYFVLHRDSLTAAGAIWGAAPAESYAAALAVLAEQLAQGDPRQVLDQGWRSEMAFEGVPTGDGRFIDPGAIQFRPTPLPLMLQTTTESGHMGAVLAGSINETGMLGQTAIGVGDFDATDAGKQMNQIIGARGKFGVSIDVAEAEGQAVCDQHGEPSYETCDEDCDITMHFSLCRIMGLTATPFPAFQDAYIEMQTQPAATAVAASAAPCTDCDQDTVVTSGLIATVGAQMGQPYTWSGNGSTSGAVNVGSLVDAVFSRSNLGALVASAPMLPPSSWFDDPGFHVQNPESDPRLFLQEHGGYACPMTIDPPDPETGLRRIYGHIGAWGQCHTAYPGSCTPPPKSRSGYAYFNMRPTPTADGKEVRIGHISMGCGHANQSRSVPFEQVAAHYDGGPGAIRLATVRVGEDAFGVWAAGFVNPAASEEQIQVFNSTCVSGDWRPLVSGRGRELVAILGGVTVPGFPVTALAASGQEESSLIYELPTMMPIADDLALVAAGIVRRPEPWERTQALHGTRLAAMEAQVDRMAKILRPLAPLAAERLQASAHVFAAPTAVDKIMPGLLAKAMQDVHDSIVEQAKDPDAASDPTDKKIAAALQAVASNLLDAIRLQGEDGADDDGPSQDATTASALEAVV